MARPLNGTILILLYIPCGKMIAYLFSAQTYHLRIVTCICVRYHIQTWPVPGNSEFLTQLQAPCGIAFHTATGGICQPIGCIGIRPAICRTGPIYNRNRMQCPRGILTAEKRLRNHCEITISHARTAQTIISELQPDIFVIISTGERFSLLCSGRAERRVRITGGVFTIRIPPGCRVSNVGFSITGVVHRNSRVTISKPTITIKPFRLAKTVTRESVAAHLHGPHWAALGRVENIKLSSLDDDPLGSSGIIWGSYPHHTSWIALSIIIALIIIVICVKVFQCARNPDRRPVRNALRHGRLIWRRNRRPRTARPPTDEDWGTDPDSMPWRTDEEIDAANAAAAATATTTATTDTPTTVATEVVASETITTAATATELDSTYLHPSPIPTTARPRTITHFSHVHYDTIPDRPSTEPRVTLPL